MTARPRTSAAIEASRLVPTIRVSGATPEQLRTWRADAKRAELPLAAWIRAACEEKIARDAAPPNTVREEDDTGVRFVDRSQAMIDRNR